MSRTTAKATAPASEAQRAFLTRLLAERQHDLGTVDFDTLSKPSASALIDLLTQSPRKPRDWDNEPLPEDTSPARRALVVEREAVVARARAAYEAAQASAKDLAERLGVKAGRPATCATCGHKHEGHACGEWVHLGYDSDYPCGCSEYKAPAEGEVAVWEWQQVNEAPLYKALREAQDALYEAQWDADALRRGDRVVVVKGRKIPKGLTGTLLTVRDGQWGRRALVLFDATPESPATKGWIAESNLSFAR